MNSPHCFALGCVRSEADERDVSSVAAGAQSTLRDEVLITVPRRAALIFAEFAKLPKGAVSRNALQRDAASRADSQRPRQYDFER